MVIRNRGGIEYVLVTVGLSFDELKLRRKRESAEG
jgi:hypothetical protein